MKYLVTLHAKLEGQRHGCEMGFILVREYVGNGHLLTSHFRCEMEVISLSSVTVRKRVDECKIYT